MLESYSHKFGDDFKLATRILGRDFANPHYSPDQFCGRPLRG